MANSKDNPFKIPREARDKILTFRVTPTELEALQALAKKRKVEIVDLVRDGLAVVLDNPNAAAATRAKE